MTQTILQTEHPNRNSKLQSFRIPHPMGRAIQTFHAETVREKQGLKKYTREHRRSRSVRTGFFPNGFPESSSLL